MMEFFCDNSERRKAINYFRKSSILDVWLSSKHACKVLQLAKNYSKHNIQGLTEITENCILQEIPRNWLRKKFVVATLPSWKSGKMKIILKIKLQNKSIPKVKFSSDIKPKIRIFFFEKLPFPYEQVYEKAGPEKETHTQCSYTMILYSF